MGLGIPTLALGPEAPSASLLALSSSSLRFIMRAASSAAGDSLAVLLISSRIWPRIGHMLAIRSELWNPTPFANAVLLSKILKETFEANRLEWRKLGTAQAKKACKSGA